MGSTFRRAWEPGAAISWAGVDRVVNKATPTAAQTHRFRAARTPTRILAGCGRSLPEQDAMAIKWKKAMEGFFHGQPAQDAMAIDPGNPRRFLRSIKWKKAMEGFFHGQLELQTRAVMPCTVSRPGIHRPGRPQP
jgi:hypothetical protein